MTEQEMKRPTQCKWPTCQSEEYQQALAEQIKRELVGEQPTQEPVGYEHHEYRPYGVPGEVRIHAVLASQYKMPDGTIADDFKRLIDGYKADPNTIKLLPLYTSPPAQRPWIGLTDKEIADIATSHPLTWVNLNIVEHRRYFARAIEAKLRSNIGALAEQPAQRPWVGLTDEEIQTIWRSSEHMNEVEVCRAIEAKIKEKTNGQLVTPQTTLQSLKQTNQKQVHS